MYFPHAQTGRAAFFMPRGMALIVRTSGDSMSLARAVKATVHDIDPTVPVSETRTLEEVVDTAVATLAAASVLLLVTAAVASALPARRALAVSPTEALRGY